MKVGKLLAVLCIAVTALTAIDDAFARGSRSGGHSGGSHSSSGSHRSNKGHSSKARSDFIIGKCKSSACFNKHPSGQYAIPPRKK